MLNQIQISQIKKEIAAASDISTWDFMAHEEDGVTYNAYAGDPTGDGVGLVIFSCETVSGAILWGAKVTIIEGYDNREFFTDKFSSIEEALATVTSMASDRLAS